jgi:SnoaL-like protein
MGSDDDSWAIFRTIAFYSGYAGQLNAAKMVEVFLPDAVVSGVAPLMGASDPDIVGAKAIQEFFEPTFVALECLQQLSMPYDIQLEGDSATAHTAITEFAKMKGGPLLMLTGDYHDDLVRTPQGWRFKKRVLVPKRLTALSELPTH